MNDHERVEVTVGVDGSASSLEAVKWAAAEAAALVGTLRIIHAVPWPALYGPRGPSATRGPVTAEAGRVLEEAESVATDRSPSLKIDTELIPGAPQMVLTVASHEADMLVLGNRGRGGFTGMLMGSLAAALAHRASCPVVIVRGSASPSGPVVVGVDGSPADRLVLGAAFERAQREGTSVCAIHAWDAPEPFLPTPPWSREAEVLQSAAGRVLRVALAPFEASHPGVPVEASLVTRSATAALVDASERALIVVVGSHGSGALRGLLAGSVCHGVMYHARCPVEIIHVADEIAQNIPRYDPVELVDHT
jgi:nucleotide-binding universal stress UspA family protein